MMPKDGFTKNGAKNGDVTKNTKIGLVYMIQIYVKKSEKCWNKGILAMKDIIIVAECTKGMGYKFEV